MPWLINALQLDKFRKSQKNILIFDASLYSDNRNPQLTFSEKHLVGAHFFDIDAFSDTSSPLPHTLIHDPERIADILGKMGIKNDCKIVFYDNSDLHTSCRALWMLKVFGHNPNLLYILDGGLKSWEKMGGKVESGDNVPTPKQYVVSFDTQAIKSLTDMKENLHTNTYQVVDLRHAVRYAGGKEPRENIRSGHIPGSLCLPFSVLFDKEGCFISTDKIKKKFIDTHINPAFPIITTCGSGLTAPILNFILDVMLLPNNAVYDGSWTEWGATTVFAGEKSLSERPIETCVDN